METCPKCGSPVIADTGRRNGDWVDLLVCTNADCPYERPDQRSETLPLPVATPKKKPAPLKVSPPPQETVEKAVAVAANITPSPPPVTAPEALLPGVAEFEALAAARRLLEEAKVARDEAKQARSNSGHVFLETMLERAMADLGGDSGMSRSDVEKYLRDNDLWMELRAQRPEKFAEYPLA